MYQFLVSPVSVLVLFYLLLSFFTFPHCSHFIISPGICSFECDLLRRHTISMEWNNFHMQRQYVKNTIYGKFTRSINEKNNRHARSSSTRDHAAPFLSFSIARSLWMEWKFLLSTQYKWKIRHTWLLKMDVIWLKMHILYVYIQLCAECWKHMHEIRCIFNIKVTHQIPWDKPIRLHAIVHVLQCYYMHISGCVWSRSNIAIIIRLEEWHVDIKVRNCILFYLWRHGTWYLDSNSRKWWREFCRKMCHFTIFWEK